METKLSRDAHKLLVQLYKLYLERRKSGLSKCDSRDFGSYENIMQMLDSSLSADDMNDTLLELKRAEYLSALFADDVCCESCLTDSAIIEMENRFKDGLASVVSFLLSLK